MVTGRSVLKNLLENLKQRVERDKFSRLKLVELGSFD